MSTPTDLHLSDVHLLAEDGSSDGGEAPCVTSFLYIAGAEACTKDRTVDDASVVGDAAAVDEDGDLICARRKRQKQGQPSRGQILICHALSTHLSDVGLQVWRGALLLCDYLMAPTPPLRLPHAVVLDLGAGCGLTSIAAALGGASTIFCTDAHHSSLANAVQNADKNGIGAVRVRALDWSRVELWPEVTVVDTREPTLEGAGAQRELTEVGGSASLGSREASRFGWSAADLETLKGATLLCARPTLRIDAHPTLPPVPPKTALYVRAHPTHHAWRADPPPPSTRHRLAADCVYDDGATTAMVRLLARMLPALGPSAVGIVSLERRINFCLDGMRPRAPAAEHFHARLERSGLTATEICVSTVPTCFDYERVPTLELWRITAARGDVAGSGAQTL